MLFKGCLAAWAEPDRGIVGLRELEILGIGELPVVNELEPLVQAGSVENFQMTFVAIPQMVLIQGSHANGSVASGGGPLLGLPHTMGHNSKSPVFLWRVAISVSASYVTSLRGSRRVC